MSKVFVKWRCAALCGIAVVCAVALCWAVLSFFRSGQDDALPEAPVSKAVESAVAGIVGLVVPKGGCGVAMKELDVRRMSAEDFRGELEALASDNVTVWMPGETKWLLIGWNGTNLVSLADAMEAFSVDSESVISLPEIFSSYVGTREEILPAFQSRLDGMVLPEWFVPREIPSLMWLDPAGVDRDILRSTLAEIRSMQVVRRLVLEGNMLARTATDKAGEEEAASKWAKASLRNPRDPMLVERLERLERNAKGFLEVGKVLQAMKCYETMILVNPNNAVAIHNFGMCLKRIGRMEMAEKVLTRARELAK